MARLIDLTHVLVPGQSGRKFTVEMVGAEQVNPKVIHLENQWYIMHNIAMVSHIGTHIEAPYHILKDADDLAKLPLDRLCGEAVVLDLRRVPPKSIITPEQVEAAAREAGGVRAGDIVLCNLGYADRYGTPEYADAPCFSTAALRWLVDAGMKLMGVDATGVELPQSEEHVNHHMLFQHGVPLIENVANFGRLTRSRCQVYAFPLAIQGMEAFPVRVVAAEPD